MFISITQQIVMFSWTKLIKAWKLVNISLGNNNGCHNTFTMDSLHTF
jgi:hypothetical protein